MKLILLRPFGNLIYDIAAKYDGINIQELRQFEKLKTNINRANLDVTFLNNCKSFDVFPKFLLFKLVNTNPSDTRFIRKKLLRTSIYQREKEIGKFEVKLQSLTSKLKSTLTAIDFYILLKTANWNVYKQEESLIKTHQKKLSNRTKNSALPFKNEETITNLSSLKLSRDELDVLKNGLNHAIVPSRINKTDVLLTFDMIHRTLKKDLKR